MENKRYNAIQEAHIDHRYAYNRSWKVRLAVWLFRGSIRNFAKSLCDEAYDRSIIDSAAIHEMTSMIDRMLNPKNYVYQCHRHAPPNQSKE